MRAELYVDVTRGRESTLSYATSIQAVGSTEPHFPCLMQTIDSQLEPPSLGFAARRFSVPLRG